jgi:hypothetical protein
MIPPKPIAGSKATVTRYNKTAPQLAAWLKANITEALTVLAFPKGSDVAAVEAAAQAGLPPATIERLGTLCRCFTAA